MRKNADSPEECGTVLSHRSFPLWTLLQQLDSYWITPTSVPV